ncbi:unnamed protein product [Bursaphelenchus xylophilus]|uniref:(pine wood nematode) hypothetical protein n=1 Tax=Bursaphelenchus xylophilus TaxID=6326 RepID=A0A1I7SQ11_BURXY|nr:unnamed protein product [Bursaphelenchus xylophilus]CAG9109470.1 unnamed protein product [Bursaphelenchus xylophilus]
MQNPKCEWTEPERGPSVQSAMRQRSFELLTPASRPSPLHWSLARKQSGGSIREVRALCSAKEKKKVEGSENIAVCTATIHERVLKVGCALRECTNADCFHDDFPNNRVFL